MQQIEFEILIRQIRPRLHQEALHYLTDKDEAEDTTQEVVLKLWAMQEQLNAYRNVEALAVVMVRHLALRPRRRNEGDASHQNATRCPTNCTPNEAYRWTRDF